MKRTVTVLAVALSAALFLSACEKKEAQTEAAPKPDSLEKFIPKCKPIKNLNGKIIPCDDAASAAK